ncbi:MAG: aldehyde dehydrogenase family protein, partial [Nocardioides sp.]
MSQTPPYQVTNPATGEIVETFPFATDAEVETALAGSQAAYESWRAVPVDERAAIVRRIGELFAERADELGALITTEMGKAPEEAAGEAGFCAEIFGYYAESG